MDTSNPAVFSITRMHNDNPVQLCNCACSCLDWINAENEMHQLSARLGVMRANIIKRYHAYKRFSTPKVAFISRELPLGYCLPAIVHPSSIQIV